MVSNGAGVAMNHIQKGTESDYSTIFDIDIDEAAMLAYVTCIVYSNTNGDNFLLSAILVIFMIILQIVIFGFNAWKAYLNDSPAN